MFEWKSWQTSIRRRLHQEVEFWCLPRVSRETRAPRPRFEKLEHQLFHVKQLKS
jgi:hypothetical protein